MRNTLAAVLVAGFFVGKIHHAFAQGSLTPPGAPAPTMKTLDQIEPRRAITNVPAFIVAPGSYYFTTNLIGVSGSDGIQVYASDVTLDFNGFSLAGVPGAGVGIYFINATNVTIRNGTIKSWQSGIDGYYGRNSRFQDLRIHHCPGSAIFGHPGGRVENCFVSECGSGIALFEGSRAVGCTVISNSASPLGGFNDGVEIENCVARHNSGGIVVGRNGRIKDCIADRNGAGGFETGDGSVISGCTSQGHTAYGFYLGKHTRMENCLSLSNDATGISLADNGQVDGCIVAFSQIGIEMGDNTTVQNSTINGNFNHGLRLSKGGATVMNSIIRSNVNMGISAGGAITVSGCTIEFNRYDGIDLQMGYSTIVNNTIRSNGLTLGFGGIWVVSRNNRIEGNHLVGNTGSGIFANFQNSTNNLIIRNSATGNTSGNYNLNPTNHFAITTSFNVATNTNPHVNFSY